MGMEVLPSQQNAEGQRIQALHRIDRRIIPRIITRAVKRYTL